MPVGFTDTEIRRNAYLQQIVSTIQNYTIFAIRAWFPTAPPAITPGGERITWMADYNATSNGGIMGTPYDAFPAPDSKDRVSVYQLKDYFQHSEQIWDILVNQVEVNRDGSQVPGTSYSRESADNAAKLLAADIASAYIAALLADISATGTFSDAAVSRATYNLASNVINVGGVLAGSDLDELLRIQGTRQYGYAKPNELAWTMNSTNHQRVAGLATKGQYTEFNASSDGTGMVDGSAIHRVGAWGTVPIMIENELPDTDILLLKKGVHFVSDHWLPGTRNVPQNSWSEFNAIGMGSNLITTNPRFVGRLDTISG